VIGIWNCKEERERVQAGGVSEIGFWVPKGNLWHEENSPTCMGLMFLNFYNFILHG